jgi:hypothetical protein
MACGTAYVVLQMACGTSLVRCPADSCVPCRMGLGLPGRVVWPAAPTQYMARGEVCADLVQCIANGTHTMPGSLCAARCLCIYMPAWLLVVCPASVGHMSALRKRVCGGVVAGAGRTQRVWWYVCPCQRCASACGGAGFAWLLVSTIATGTVQQLVCGVRHMSIHPQVYTSALPKCLPVCVPRLFVVATAPQPGCQPRVLLLHRLQHPSGVCLHTAAPRRCVLIMVMCAFEAEGVPGMLGSKSCVGVAVTARQAVAAVRRAVAAARQAVAAARQAVAAQHAVAALLVSIIKFPAGLLGRLVC